MTEPTTLDQAAVDAEHAAVRAELAAEAFGPLRDRDGCIDLTELETVRTLRRRAARARNVAEAERRRCAALHKQTEGRTDHGHLAS